MQNLMFHYHKLSNITFANYVAEIESRHSSNDQWQTTMTMLALFNGHQPVFDRCHIHFQFGIFLLYPNIYLTFTIFIYYICTYLVYGMTPFAFTLDYSFYNKILKLSYLFLSFLIRHLGHIFFIRSFNGNNV